VRPKLLQTTETTMSASAIASHRHIPAPSDWSSSYAYAWRFS
jgi:hypothetical protein